MSNIPELRRILLVFVEQLSGKNTAGWGGVWLLLALAAALGRQGFLRRGIVALWVLFSVNLAVYALVLTTKSWTLPTLSNGLERLLLHATPVAVCLIGWQWAGFLNAEILKTKYRC